MFQSFNSSEIDVSTSTCTRLVFSEEGLNSFIRKTVHRTNIRLHVVSHPLQVLIQRCPIFKENDQLGGESDLSGIRRPGCGIAAESACSKREAQQGKIFKNVTRLQQVRVGCPLDASACKEMKEDRAEPRACRAFQAAACKLHC